MSTMRQLVIRTRRHPDARGRSRSWCSSRSHVRRRLRRDVGRPPPGAERRGRGRAGRSRGAGVRRLQRPHRHRPGQDAAREASQVRTGSGARRRTSTLRPTSRFQTVPVSDPLCGSTRVSVSTSIETSPAGNPLPVSSGPSIGLTTQGVRAMAIARAGAGECQRLSEAWAIPDKWLEVRRQRIGRA